MRIELTTPNLPSWCSTTELPRHRRNYTTHRTVILNQMNRWRVGILVIAAGFLGILLYTFFAKPVLAPDFHRLTRGPLVKNDITILLTGDIMLGRSVMGVSLKKNDPAYPFRNVGNVLSKSDLVFANLENPIVEKCPRSDSGFKFCSDPKMIDGLKFAGIDVVNIANNHSGNYGEEGVIQTKNFLQKAGIDYVGDGNLVIRDAWDTKFGFLGFDYVGFTPKEADFQLISDSKQNVDVLIVAVHWGLEYTEEPTKSEELIAKKLTGAGADVVYGTHPHWVQSIDHINGKPVYYSLGNFIFDQMWSEETRKGLVVKLVYRDGKLIGEEKLPIYMQNFAQPEWVR